MVGRRSGVGALKRAISVLKGKAPRQIKAPLRKVRKAQRTLTRRARTLPVAALLRKVRNATTRPGKAWALMKHGTQSADAVVVAALAERLREAARHLLEEDPYGAASDDAAERAAALLPPLVEVARKPEATAQRWLLFVAIHGRYPGTAEFLRLSRAMELDAPEVSTVALLDSAVTASGPYADRGMQVVTGMPVVEVTTSGAVDFVTGIQRTVRETLRYWSLKHPLALAMWHRDSCAMRSPTPKETDPFTGRRRAPAMASRRHRGRPYPRCALPHRRVFPRRS